MIRDIYLEQLGIALEQGWIPFFQNASMVHNIPIEILFGIASRESGFRNIVGDNGRGFGIMQIDLGTDPTAISHGLDPEWNINRGAQLLNEKRQWVIDHAGKPAMVYWHGQRLEFNVPLDIESNPNFNRIWIAAYNCGIWSSYHFDQGRDPDHGTTQRNYSHDVMARSERFYMWLAKIREFCK